MLDTGIGKAFLDRFSDVCAHRRRAWRGPSNAAHKESDRERRRGRAPGAAETERDRSPLRRIRRARKHHSDKGSKARVHRPLGTRANGDPSSARRMGGRLGICRADDDAVPPTKLCAVERRVPHQKARRLLRWRAPPGDADAGREEQRHARPVGRGRAALCAADRPLAGRCRPWLLARSSSQAKPRSHRELAIARSREAFQSILQTAGAQAKRTASDVPYEQPRSAVKQRSACIPQPD